MGILNREFSNLYIHPPSSSIAYSLYNLPGLPAYWTSKVIDTRAACVASAASVWNQSLLPSPSRRLPRWLIGERKYSHGQAISPGEHYTTRTQHADLSGVGRYVRAVARDSHLFKYRQVSVRKRGRDSSIFFCTNLGITYTWRQNWYRRFYKLRACTLFIKCVWQYRRCGKGVYECWKIFRGLCIIPCALGEFMRVLESYF